VGQTPSAPKEDPAMKLDQEARRCLAERGQSRRGIARLLGCAESTVRYQLQRQAEGAVDWATEAALGGAPVATSVKFRT